MLNESFYLLHVEYSICSLVDKRFKKTGLVMVNCRMTRVLQLIINYQSSTSFTTSLQHLLQTIWHI